MGLMLPILFPICSQLAPDLSLSAGSVLGLVAKNGTGKTTLLKCALGLQHPQRGDVHILGEPAWEQADQKGTEKWISISLASRIISIKSTTFQIFVAVSCTVGGKSRG
jgi:ABC-type cobalamin/Fe3+-siderophores transport system ATPase subunit